MANMIARLGVVLGLDTAEFNRGIEQAGRKLEQISQAAERFSKIGVTAMAAASAAALAYADEIADVAQANEVAIGTVLKLSNALANAGGKADSTGKMLASFTKFIDDAAGGSLQAQKTAALLGVTLQDLGKLSEEELLNKVVKNLGEMDDSITRNATAMDIFGKAAKGVDFVGFAEEMGQANKLTDEQAVAIKQAADAHDMLAQSARDTMVVIGSALGPVLKTSIEYLKDMKGETNALGQIFKTVFETIAVVAANVSFVIKTLVEDFVAIGKAGVALFKGDFAEIGRIYAEATERAKQDRAKLDKFELNILSPSSQASDSGSGLGSMPQVAGRKVTKARDPEAERAERERLRWIRHMNEEARKYAKLLFDIEAQQVQAYTNESKRIEKEQRSLEIKNGLLDIEIKTRDMRSEDIQLAKDLYLAEQKRLDTIQEINRNNLLDEDAKAQLIERENALADATERYLRAQNQAVKAQREGSFGEGFMKEGNKFFRDMPTELENGAKAFQSVMGNMESALDNFVRTGKLSFKSLARSIIQDLIAIQLKASASSIFKSLFGSYGFLNDKGGMEVAGSLGFADGGENPL